MIALLLGGLAAWMLGNRVEIGRALQIIITLAAAAGGFSYYWIRFIRSAPRLVTLTGAGIELRWRNGAVERCEWKDVRHGLHEEDKGLHWRLSLDDGALMIHDRGISPRGWEQLSRGIRANLERVGAPWEATGAVAQAFTEDDPEELHTSLAGEPVSEESVIERMAAEEVAREALLTGNTNVFHSQMDRLEDIAPEDSGVHRRMSEYVLAIDRGDFLWMFFELWDVDPASRHVFDGALARSLGEGLEERGEPLLAATAYAWADEPESDARVERLVAEHGLGTVKSFERKVVRRARVYFEKCLHDADARGESESLEQAALLHRLAEVEHRDGAPERAMQHAQRAQELGADALELRVLVATLHKERGEHDRAFAVLDDATDAYPDRGLALARKGLWLLELRGDTPGAIDCLQGALTREPALEEARRRLRVLVRKSARTGAHSVVG